MRIVKIVQLAVCVLVLGAILSPAIKADGWDKKTVVTFAEAVEIPGQVLPAGTYVFKLANSISDRHIVQIWTGDESELLATLLTIRDQRAGAQNKPIFEFDERPGDSPMAIRAWFYPGDTSGQQFLY
jgi:hypothetical protein